MFATTEETLSFYIQALEDLLEQMNRQVGIPWWDYMQDRYSDGGVVLVDSFAQFQAARREFAMPMMARRPMTDMRFAICDTPVVPSTTPTPFHPIRSALG